MSRCQLRPLAAALLAVTALAARAQQPAPPAAGAAPSPAPARPARAPDVVFIPTPERVVEAMLDLAKVGKDDVVYDLGCGDGRIVVAAARRGARKAVGIDIDPERVAEARRNVRASGVGGRAEIREGDLFEADFSDATVVTLYLLPELNLRLRPKLLALRPGTRVVSHSFEMGEWQPDASRVVDGKSIYVWTVPAGPRLRSTSSGSR